jgi:hypothetical protein
MDLERKPVDEEDKNDKVNDGVADRRLDSENNGRDEGEIMLRKSHVEVQSLLKTEEPGLLRDKNSECAQNTGEEGHITNTPLHDQPPIENVTDGTNSSAEVGSVPGTNSSAENGSVPKSTDVKEVGSVPDESNEKGIDDLQNSGDKTEAENMDVKFLQTVNHSERAQANNKGDENTVCTETKQVKESENKVDSIKPGSTKRNVKEPSTTQGEWKGSNVLLVRGLASPQSGVSEILPTNGQIINITTLPAPIYNVVRCKIGSFHSGILKVQVVWHFVLCEMLNSNVLKDHSA